jgi:photosystem II stability/assembly factor-like uncharacterized protein
MRTAALIFLLTLATQAQFQIQNSQTTASLRGIHALNDQIAWASGTQGTVLHTTDGGATWQTCTTPPDAEKLDFRGIQAFDQNTAIVMSSGKGDLSRLYKTTDACRTWKLLFTNPDKEGFWDALAIAKTGDIFVLGDPVRSEFKLFCSNVDDNQKWGEGCSQEPFRANKDEAAFAASNSSLSVVAEDNVCFVTGGSLPEMICQHNGVYGSDGKILNGNRHVNLPLASGPTAGAFSIIRTNMTRFPVVGGDYLKSDDPAGTGAFTTDGGQHWIAATTPPHGYRSAVAYDPTTKTWITVGPNGTDISRDDGRNWTALKPGPTDQPDADKNWNALSLPFVVGPNGRIGKLTPGVLKGAP